MRPAQLGLQWLHVYFREIPESTPFSEACVDGIADEAWALCCILEGVLNSGAAFEASPAGLRIAACAFLWIPRVRTFFEARLVRPAEVAWESRSIVTGHPNS